MFLWSQIVDLFSFFSDDPRLTEEVSLTVHDDGSHSTNVDAKKNLYLYEVRAILTLNILILLGQYSIAKDSNLS